MEVFFRSVKRRAELQTVALEDIANRLKTLRSLAAEPMPDDAKVHETLRDLARVFEGLAENAQAFMAGIGRNLELQQADATAVAAYKKRLIEGLQPAPTTNMLKALTFLRSNERIRGRAAFAVPHNAG